MSAVFIIFWVVLALASIAWYGFLVFYVGIKAGREIREIKRPPVEPPPNDDPPGAAP